MLCEAHHTNTLSLAHTHTRTDHTYKLPPPFLNIKYIPMIYVTNFFLLYAPGRQQHETRKITLFNSTPIVVRIWGKERKNTGLIRPVIGQRQSEQFSKHCVHFESGINNGERKPANTPLHPPSLEKIDPAARFRWLHREVC